MILNRIWIDTTIYRLRPLKISPPRHNRARVGFMNLLNRRSAVRIANGR